MAGGFWQLSEQTALTPAGHLGPTCGQLDWHFLRDPSVHCAGQVEQAGQSEVQMRVLLSLHGV